MKLIVGLGNPGRDYQSTRHNVGWWLLDRIAARWSFDAWKRDFDSLVTRSDIGGQAVALLKPQTYMNLSGAALTPYLNKASFDASQDLLIMVDDVAIPIGTFRLRAQGSAGGHNGLKSIERAVGSQSYARLRIGIRPPMLNTENGLADFVLGPLSAAERGILVELEPELVAAANTWLVEGIGPAMNKHNRKALSEE